MRSKRTRRRSRGSPRAARRVTRRNDSRARSACRKAPSSGSPTPVSSLSASSACSEPITPGGRAEHARGRAGGRVRRRLGEGAAVAGGLPRPDAHHEAARAEHAGLDERDPRRAAGGVDGVAGLERVAAVHDEVGALDQAGGVGGVEAHLVGLDDDLRVEEAELGGGAVRLGDADVGREVQELAVQVGQLDLVAVDDPQPPHARPGEVERDRRAERPGADDQHARGAAAPAGRPRSTPAARAGASSARGSPPADRRRAPARQARAPARRP